MKPSSSKKNLIQKLHNILTKVLMEQFINVKANWRMNLYFKKTDCTLNP